MKTLIHKRTDVNICIFSWESNIVKGFFFKEKPEVGDLLMSYERCETNFLYLYKVVKILGNRDSKAVQGFDNKNTYFELEVELLNHPETLALPEEYEAINTSVREAF